MRPRSMSWRKVSVMTALAMVAGGIVWAHWPRKPLPADTRADRVVVRKAARTLELYRGAELLRTYSIALGRDPVGHKAQEGDNKTPEGQYVLDYRNAASSFHKALHVSYPSPADIAAARARNVSPGGAIMVHGIRNGMGFLGRLHRMNDWTAGCIAVTNQDIDEIWRVVPDGTPILIEP